MQDCPGRLCAALSGRVEIDQSAIVRRANLSPSAHSAGDSLRCSHRPQQSHGRFRRAPRDAVHTVRSVCVPSLREEGANRIPAQCPPHRHRRTHERKIGDKGEGAVGGTMHDAQLSRPGLPLLFLSETPQPRQTLRDFSPKVSPQEVRNAKRTRKSVKLMTSGMIGPKTPLKRFGAPATHPVVQKCRWDGEERPCGRLAHPAARRRDRCRRHCQSMSQRAALFRWR